MKMKTDESDGGKTNEAHKPGSFKRLYFILILVLLLVFVVVFVSPRKQEIIVEISSHVTTETNNNNPARVWNYTCSVVTETQNYTRASSTIIRIMSVMILIAIIMGIFGMAFGGSRQS